MAPLQKEATEKIQNTCESAATLMSVTKLMLFEI